VLGLRELIFTVGCVVLTTIAELHKKCFFKINMTLLAGQDIALFPIIYLLSSSAPLITQLSIYSINAKLTEDGMKFMPQL
jgi:hypothetical protein